MAAALASISEDDSESDIKACMDKELTKMLESEK
jgi:hypothetical protein